MTIEYGPITGSDIVCYSPNETFTIHNSPSGSSVSWTKSSNLTYVSETTTTYTVHANSSSTSGEGWVQAYITSTGCDAKTIRYNLWVGVPDPTIDGDQYLECYDREWYFLQPEDMWGEGYYWHTTYQLRVIGSPYGHKAQIEALQEGTGLIFCDVDNECGTGYGSLMVWIECGFFMMSPNPADDYVEISIDENKLAENKIDDYEVRIYNSMYIMVSQIKTRKPVIRINTRQFINGIYIVHFITGDKLQVEQLVISH